MFDQSFKHYKRKLFPPDLEKVLSFDDSENWLSYEVKCAIGTQVPLGVMPVHDWKCFHLRNYPGLIVIQNPFTAMGHRYWISRCLKDYPRKPNIVNLNKDHFDQVVIEDWWSSLQTCREEQLKKKLKKSMRWTTLGYHHNWNTKVYSETMKNDFPKDLFGLTEFFANILNYKNYSPEAAIVNYYPFGTTLAGHTDKSESDLDSPLFSFSFGQTAIFLLGGHTKETKPMAFLIKSGDVIMMSKYSRLCYHAVPKILRSDDEPWNYNIRDEKYMPHYPNSTLDTFNHESEKNKTKNLDSCVDELFNIDINLWAKCRIQDFWTDFNSYIKNCRININVRQVLKEGQTSL